MALKRDSWTLLAIAAADGAPLTPVQLQKALFLLSKELPGATASDPYTFVPYSYGPFDKSIYEDADQLAARGLVTITRPYRWAEYSATPDGLRAASELARLAPQDAVRYLQQAVAWTRRLTFQQVVSAIYARYPEFRANSVFQG